MVICIVHIERGSYTRRPRAAASPSWRCAWPGTPTGRPPGEQSRCDVPLEIR